MAAKTLPAINRIFNSRTQNLLDTESTRSTILCDLGNNSFKIPDDQDCLMSVITAEIPNFLYTFDTIPSFSITGLGDAVTSITSVFQLQGVDINTAYTIATLRTAITAKTYTHGTYTLTLTVTAVNGTNQYNFAISGGVGDYFIQGKIPQIGLTSSSQYMFPFTAPTSPKLSPNYFVVRSPDLQTMYSQPIAKFQCDVARTNTVFYKNYSNFETRILSPFVGIFQLQIQDEDGVPLNLRGYDWSVHVLFRFIPKQNLEIK